MSAGSGAEIAGPGRPGRLAALALGAVGVVYGDIGTSPLYAFREALRPAAADGLAEAEVLGVVSLLLWAIVLVVTLKYVLVLLRADNRGEGGVLSLVALVQRARPGSTLVLGLAIAGAALFFGDAIITPAISVLSAIEGLELVTPAFDPYVLPLSAAILVGLFLVQRRGTGPLARWFGPVTALWFSAMAATGLMGIAAGPEILAALDPRRAAGFLAQHGIVGFTVLGAVFLAVTGAEALYADLGHFGRRPIQIAWFALVFPALGLNYLGQGALVLADPAALANPFYLLVPGWALPGYVVLATMATVIASQAVITGAFSLTHQAMQLGLLPRLTVRHTSETETGQIFLPFVNLALLAGVLLLVAAFGSSERLAAAYGIAVSGTMAVTTILFWRLLVDVRGWARGTAALAVAPILAVEAAFLAANLLKLPDGGAVPLVLATILGLVMWTWWRGTRQVSDQVRRQATALASFLPTLDQSSAFRAPGLAVFLTSDAAATPPALLHNLKHNHVLHEHIVVVTVETANRPRVEDADRVAIERLHPRLDRVRMRFGYMESPNVNRALGLCRRAGIEVTGLRTTFFLGRRKLMANREIGMPLWQDRLYILLSRLAADPSDVYHLPRDRVVELGSRIAI
ncbi:KUP system potassium uptake protein [Palleronia aestuarii]|uniref:Probable potassium transport system protein Kup n=1 Tax=Palleronia aestuarii TaxID=568105 RepID=A0A2W7MZA7_9RHOB|nr:potassium transporter Kup [Palleronia aestuarii]PZX13475.1 KUP system potassium uptake protein [Palleronia aestuarii]